MTNSSVSQNLTETSRTDVKQAITLMWISVLYVVCQSPKIVPDFYEALYCKYSSVRLNDNASNDTLRGKISFENIQLNYPNVLYFFLDESYMYFNANH